MEIIPDFQLEIAFINSLMSTILSPEVSDIEHEGVKYQSMTYIYNSEVIWGATARIMKNFIDVIGERLHLPEKKD